MEWYVDRKYTAWERSFFSGTEEEFKEFIEDLKSDDSYTSDTGFKECEWLSEGYDPIPVEENYGSPTVEIYDEEGNLIWDNTQSDE